jgi:transposase
MTSVSMPQANDRVIVGVDTHADLHVAVALDPIGRVLGQLELVTAPPGYGQLLGWAHGFAPEVTFGIEGTGSYGAGLARYLADAGCSVIEVSRPNRQLRRLRGKSDPIDAEAAARSVLAGQASCVPKADQAQVGMIGTLRIARRSALKMRTQAVNQMRAVVVTAPEALRHQLRDLPTARLAAISVALRPGAVTTPAAATKLTLRCLATRYQALTSELQVLDAELARLTLEVAPALCELKGVGPDVAGALLVAAGDNPERLRSEAAFASLCGVSPVPASSGKTHRHRLNRGGNRIANTALWRITMVRLTSDHRTQQYVARRTTEGMSKREIIRCLKRYIVREVYRTLRITLLSSPRLLDNP